MKRRSPAQSVSITRRTVLAGSAGLGILMTGNVPAGASNPSRIKVRDVTITTFSDGHLSLPAQMFAPRADKAARAAALNLTGQSNATVRSPLNVTLIETGKDKILVDVGSGPHFMGTAGKLVDSLEAAGVDPESITKVVYTHAHPDHVWGTVNDFDELSFPNAAYTIAEAEWNFWMAKDVLTKLPKERHGFAVGAQRNLKAAKEQLTTIKPGAELVPGIAILDTSGHTPGHISLEVGSARDSVVILGDALTHPVISFRHPDWQPAVDQDPDQAVRTRKRLLDQLARGNRRIVGYHLPQPGIGRVVAKGQQFAFEPAV